MKVQTLVVTTGQTDFSLPGKMNLQTDSLIGNQCGKNEICRFEYNGRQICYLSSDTRGVGINRNQILMRAEGELCVLADDDMTFLAGYEATVTQWFAKLPKADMLIFNLQGGKKRYVNRSVRRITRFNYGRYGAARLAFRTRSVRFAGVTFHTMFGGGCEYSCGEDSLFLRECIRRGLKIYAVPAAIAQIEDGNSTWFTGYTDKFFFDKGVLYYALDKRFCKPLSVIHCWRHRNKYKSYGVGRAIRQMWKGIGSVNCVK